MGIYGYTVNSVIRSDCMDNGICIWSWQKEESSGRVKKRPSEKDGRFCVKRHESICAGEGQKDCP